MTAVPMTPRSLPDPGKPPTPVRTLTRWDTFIGDLSSGLGITESMKKCYVTRADIETMCRLDDGGLQRQRFEDARLAGLKSAWSVFDFEHFFALIAEGKKVDEAHLAVRGVPIQTGFYYLLNADAELAGKYRKAKEAAMLAMADGVLELADDNSGDTLDGPRGGEIPNMAAVGRSKLQVDTRLRLMGAFHAKLFGERKDNVAVQVNINPAERLEEARARANNRGVVAPKKVEAIDAQFSEVTPVPAADTDTSWIDAASTDTVWREEK
jgi:hypothetical protein